MELDDMKGAWQHVDAGLGPMERMELFQRAEQAGGRMQSSLRPLLGWQWVQLAAGVVLALVAGLFWTRHTDQALLLGSGLVLHAYGIALIVHGARVVWRLQQLDYSAPVTTLQRDLAGLERSYVRSGWMLSLPWWVLWVPFLLVGMQLVGVDVAEASLDAWLLANMGVGVLGMLLTVAVFRWAHRSTRPGFRERLVAFSRVESIERARQALVEVERFERG